MALSQYFMKHCSVSSPSCTNTLNQCSVTECSQYCRTRVCADRISPVYRDKYGDESICEQGPSKYLNSYYEDDPQGGPPAGYLNTPYYVDYANYCAVYIENYTEDVYYNYKNSYHDSSYYEYGNYKNSNNYCRTSWTYYNYADAYATKLGGSYTPSWSNSVPSSNSEINSNFLKELRDKVKQLSTTKQRNQVDDTNINSGSGTSSDSKLGQFNEIDNLSIENIRTTLNNIYSELNQTIPSIGSIGDNNTYMKTDVFTSIKNAINTLAKKDISSSYVNYLNSSYNNSSSSYINMSNIPSSIVIYDNYSDTSSSYVNSIYYVNYSETTSTITYKNTGTYKNS